METGYVEIDITPEIGVELLGFAQRQQPSGYLIDPLKAQCLLLSSGNKKIAWITLDVIGLETTFCDTLASEIQKIASLKDCQLIISASHTHSGPGTLHLNNCGAYDAGYVHLLKQKLKDIIVSAAGKLKKTDIAYGTVKQDFGIDRRNVDEICVEDEISFLIFSVRKKIAFILINCGIHPVCLRSEGISADYPGRLRMALEGKIVGRPKVMFTLGACGNVNPFKVGMSLRELNQMAEKIAHSIHEGIHFGVPLKLNENLNYSKINIDHLWPPNHEESIEKIYTDYKTNKFWLNEFGEPFQSALEKWKFQVKHKNPKMQLGVLKIGQLTVITIGAEIFAHYTKKVKEIFPISFIASCTNGIEGYIPDEKTKDGYEVKTSCFFFGLPPAQITSMDWIIQAISDKII